MRGTANTTEAYVTGDMLPALQVDDVTRIGNTADDDAFYEQYRLEPPAAASLTVVNVGFTPLRDVMNVAGTLVAKFVCGDAAVRQVTVAPMRVARSGTDVSLPRALLSATSPINATVALPAEPAAGNWGMLLLYAQLAYIDASNKTKGTQVTFAFAEPAYVVFANPGNFGTIPANTNTTWNIPIAYVKTFATQGVTILQEHIIEAPPLQALGFAPEGQMKIQSMQSGIDARRGYSSYDNDPILLVTAGASKWVATGLGTTQVLTYTQTPIVVGRRNVQKVEREIMIPPCAGGSAQGTAGTNGAQVATLVLDDTRNWKGANFKMTAFVAGNLVQQFAEDDAGTANKAFPTLRDTVLATNSPTMYMNCGQSYVTTIPHVTAYPTARLYAGFIGVLADVPGAGIINGVADPGYLVAGDGWAVFVDATTGYLMWYAKRASAAGAGPAVWILLEAWFGNHLAL